MSKDVKYKKEARKKILVGINAVADAVSPTLGPKGRNAIMDRGPGMVPAITNDGVSIAREISFRDRFKDMGASLLKEVAEKTNEEAGDGTTTATILAQHMVLAGLKLIKRGKNPIKVRESLELATNNVVKQLEDIAVPITDEQIKDIATYSSEDAEMGQLIADTIKEIGTDGVITVEDSQKEETYKEIIKGMRIDSGFLSPHFKTKAEIAEYKNVPVLITDQTISSFGQVAPLLEQLIQSGKPYLIIIADDVTGDALPNLVVNKLQGKIMTLCIKAPGIGMHKENALEDIAILTGGIVISQKTGMKLEETKLDMLGTAEYIKSTKKETIIINGQNDKPVADRIAELKQQIESEEAKFDKDKLKERIAKLTGGVAVLKIGMTSGTALGHRKDKIEDAINATRAAIEEGVITGGGLSLRYCKLGKTIGDKILKKALRKPYDILRKDITDKELLGIIDPLKVIKTALKNASSTVGIFLTTNTVIANGEEMGNGK